MVLENAGIAFDWLDADVDENTLKNKALLEKWPADKLAANLAIAKAEAAKTATERSNPGTWDIFIGCDQLLSLNGIIFDKPKDLSEAAAHLRAFRGKVHHLVSAVVVLQNETPPWSHIATTNMFVRQLSDAFIDDYVHNHNDGILSSVGAYRLEGYGAQLFEKIDGDYFTVLGLPLLPLLEELRKRGILPV